MRPSSLRDLPRQPSPEKEATTVETTVDSAILRTLAYASLFQYPLRLDELHRSLLGAALSRDELAARLAELRRRGRLAVEGGMVYPVGCQAWIDLRRKREQHTELLLARHRDILGRVRRLPFVRLVALSGACARGNAADDDVDVFVVTKRNRAWAVCLTVMLLSKWAGLRRSFCVNYVLDEDALVLPEQDVFTAAEIVGLRVLAGRATYRRFWQANSWLRSFFPNAAEAPAGEEPPGQGTAQGLESILDVGPAPIFEGLARLLLGSYLRFRWGGSRGVILSPHRLKLHTRDHRPRVMDAFARACADLPDLRARPQDHSTLRAASGPPGRLPGGAGAAGEAP